MTTQPANSDPSGQPTEHFWSNALIGSALGIFVGTVSVMILTALLDPFWTSGAIFVAGGISGVIAGAIQGAFVRRHARPKLLWLGVSCVGWLAYIGVAGAIIYMWPGIGLEQWIGIDALGGAIIGTAQWLVLRRLWPQAVWWVPLNAGIWAAITLVYLIVFGPLIGLASW